MRGLRIPGVSGVLTLVVAVMLMAYSAPAGAVPHGPQHTTPPSPVKRSLFAKPCRERGRRLRRCAVAPRTRVAG